MRKNMYNKHNLLENLIELGLINKKECFLKSSEVSSIKLDLNKVISFPKILSSITELLIEYSTPLLFDYILGVSYTAFSVTTCFSLKTGMPQLLCCKELNYQSAKQEIEGHFHVGERCLVVADVITSAERTLQTIVQLREAGILVTDVMCLVDKEASAKESLKKEGITLHKLFTLEEVSIKCQELQLH
jgi:orotate phosphoribosyltransferase